MNIQEELRISTYQPVAFVIDAELAKLYEAMNDYWELDKESGRAFAASVFYNLGRVHGKREERARRKRGTAA